MAKTTQSSIAIMPSIPTSIPTSIPSFKKDPQWLMAAKDIIGGTIGGFGLCLVGHPFDTMKVRLQTQSVTNPLYNGLIDCAKQTMGKEGFGGFYKGVFSPLCGQMFLNATQFLSWGQSVALVTYGTDKTAATMSVSDYAKAGVLTAFACGLVESPIDFFKSQLQVQIFKKDPLFRTVPQCFKYILNNFGLRGAYQGLSATIIRNIPFRASYFGTYEYCRGHFAGPNGDRTKLHWSYLLVAGGMAGVVQWFISYPLDVIKSSMQGDSPIREQRRFKGWVDCARQLYAEGGLKRFSRGFLPCMMRSFPANATCFVLYEQTQKFLR